MLTADIYMREEVPPHERMITLRMVFRKTYILVHVESYHITETNLAFLVHLYQISVHA